MPVFEITRVDIWVASLEDRPGALAQKLSALAAAGANLDFVIVRPTGEKAGQGVLFVAPLHGQQQLTAAEDLGLKKSSINSLRITGPDRPGIGAGITGTLAEAGINIAGMTAAVVEDRCVIYIRLESDDAAFRATQLLAARLEG